jgi:hypothetical protein
LPSTVQVHLYVWCVFFFTHLCIIFTIQKRAKLRSNWKNTKYVNAQRSLEQQRQKCS